MLLFTNTTAGHNKYWGIYYAGDMMITVWGKIEPRMLINGQFTFGEDDIKCGKPKVLGNSSEVKSAVRDLIESKTKKGYIIVSKPEKCFLCNNKLSSVSKTGICTYYSCHR